MKLNIFRRIGLRKLVLVGFALKCLLTLLLIAIYALLHGHQHDLHAQQHAFAALQQAVTSLQQQVALHKSATVPSVTASPFGEKLQALRTIEKISKQLALGEVIDLYPIKPFASDSEWQNLATLRKDQLVADVDLQKALVGCTSENEEAQSSHKFEKFIKVEKVATHLQNDLTKTHIAQALLFIGNKDYQAALASLRELPIAIKTSGCITKASVVLTDKSALLTLITSIQQRILNNE
jgi:hypothetical protein